IYPTTLPPSVAQSGMAPAVQIGRMDVPPELAAQLNTWYNTVYIPSYERVPGVIRGRRNRTVEGAPTDRTLYEFDHPSVSDSPQREALRDTSPATQRTRPKMRHGTGSPGVWVKTFELAR